MLEETALRLHGLSPDFIFSHPFILFLLRQLRKSDYANSHGLSTLQFLICKLSNNPNHQPCITPLIGDQLPSGPPSSSRGSSCLSRGSPSVVPTSRTPFPPVLTPRKFTRRSGSDRGKVNALKCKHEHTQIKRLPSPGPPKNK